MGTTNHWMGWRKLVVCGALSCVALGLMACGEDEKPQAFSGPMHGDTTWEGEVTVSGELLVNSKLTIEPCTKIRIADGASIRTVKLGVIRSIGTADCPITFQPDKLVPSYEFNGEMEHRYGGWGAVVLSGDGRAENEFEHTHFKQGGTFNKAMFVVERDATVSVRDILIEGSESNGVYLDEKANVKEFSRATFNHSRPIGHYSMHVGLKMAGLLEDMRADSAEYEEIFLLGEHELDEGVVLKKHGVPYLIQGVHLEDTLELEAGVQLFVQKRGGIIIGNNGSLQSLGTAEDPVVIQSRERKPEAGDWKGIIISPDARGDILIEHTEIKHAQTAIEGLPFSGPNVVVYAGLRVRNVLIEQTSGIGADLSMNVDVNEFSNVHFKDIRNYPLMMSYDGVDAIENISGEGLDKEQIWIAGGTAVRNAVWKKQAFPYYIASGKIQAKVDVDAGVEFIVDYGQEIKVYEKGAFNTHGTSSEPVVFRFNPESSKMNGQYFYRIQYYLEPSDDEPSEDLPESTLKHTVFRNYINSGGSGAIQIYKDRKVTLDNVKFEGFSCDVELYIGNELPTVIETPYRLCEKS